MCGCDILTCNCVCVTQSKYQELMADPSYIDNILEQGAEVANETAHKTLDACKDAMGFVLPQRRL